MDNQCEDVLSAEANDGGTAAAAQAGGGVRAVAAGSATWSHPTGPEQQCHSWAAGVGDSVVWLCSALENDSCTPAFQKSKKSI